MPLRRGACVTVILVIFAIVAPGTARAQAPQGPPVVAPASSNPDAAGETPACESMPGWASLFTPLGGDFKHLFSTHSLLPLGVGAAGTAAAHYWDDTVARADWDHGFAHLLSPGRVVGNSFVQAGAALAGFAIGKVADMPRLAVASAEIFRAQLVTQATTQGIKYAIRRTRPDGTPRSFPSGHSASAFATATVIQSNFGWKAGVPAFMMASWVAASRLQIEKHFLSDVVAGAVVGIVAGRAVTIGKGRARFSVSPVVVRGGAGVTFERIPNR